MVKDAYTTKELMEALDLKAESTIMRRAKAEGWQSRPRAGRGGGYEWLVASMPEPRRTALVVANAHLEAQNTEPESKATLATASISDQKRKIALARADMVGLYTEALAKAGHGGKHAARENFILAYKGGAWPELLKALGPDVSWKSIERWKVQLRQKGSIVSLVDRRGSHNKDRSRITEHHATLLLNAVLQPNAPTLSTALRMATEAMRAQGLPRPSEATMRRFIKQWKETNFGSWVYTREGKKAWNDKAAFFIERDFSLIEVGDIVVADGHVLNFQTLNPWTGKACRMELVMWYDMKSNFPLGWEIMPTENTQAIASALRRAIISLGKYPLIAYLDNGKAFRSKYFNGVDFKQTGIAGLFQELGIHTIFAWPYHGQSKTVERFFGSLHELEQWIPSYVGNNIDNKPPRLHRGEHLHRQVYEATGSRPLTLEETHYAVAKWVDAYIHRPQRGHLNGKCPAEVFDAGRGRGVDQTHLRHLMMTREERKVSREGIRLLGERYYAPELYGRTHAVQIRYDIGDLRSILVYSADGSELICQADKQKRIHPAADLLGTEEHSAELRSALALKKQQENDASSIARNVLTAALSDQRNRMVALQEAAQSQTELKAEPSPLNQAKIVSIEAAKATSRQRKGEATYTPPVERQDITTELEKYEYLFMLRYRDGIALREADSDWMEQYEATTEYQQDAAPRYKRLREYYERKRVNA